MNSDIEHPKYNMISIFLDTNCLLSNGNNLIHPICSEKLLGIIEQIETNDLYEIVQIIIPEIVLNELKTKQIEYYEIQLDKIKKVSLPNIKIDYDFDYLMYSNNVFSNLFNDLDQKQIKIKILPYPPNKILPLIINRALTKTPPFEGKNKESDKGFKDVIIWESLLEYKRKNKNDIIILCSFDGKLNDDILKKEYFKKFSDQIYFIGNSQKGLFCDLIDVISDITSNDLHLSFSAKLEKQLLSLFDWENDNFRWLYEDEKIIIEGQKCRFSYLRVLNKKVDSLIDLPEAKKIRYNVKAEIEFDFDEQLENGFATITFTEICNFIIYYQFKNDKFYIKEYDGADGETVTFLNDNFEL